MAPQPAAAESQPLTDALGRLLAPYAHLDVPSPATGGGGWSTTVISMAIRTPGSVRAVGASLNGAVHALSGIASYYWQEQMTATGEVFNKRDLTAAHKTLPFGTLVKVTRVDTGSSVIVRINDRGPFKPGRVIDLSERAAEDIGMTGRGLAAVKLEVLDHK